MNKVFSKIPFYKFGWWTGSTPNGSMLAITERPPNEEELETGYFKIQDVLKVYEKEKLAHEKTKALLNKVLARRRVPF